MVPCCTLIQELIKCALSPYFPFFPLPLILQHCFPVNQTAEEDDVDFCLYKNTLPEI